MSDTLESRVNKIELEHARLEGRIYASQERIESKLTDMARHENECRGMVKERIDRMEVSYERQGKRLGILEAEMHKISGGKAAIMGLIGTGGVIGTVLGAMVMNFLKGG